MKLNKICNMVAAKVLGGHGTVVEHMSGNKPCSVFKVLRRNEGEIRVISSKSGVGEYPATWFRRKAEQNED